MSRPRVGFLGNSASNLVVGAAALGYAVVVPAVVVRRFGTVEYGTWFVAFQIAAYVLLVDFGSQAVVTSEAANPTPDRRAARLTTAAMLAQLALAATVVGAAAAWAALAGNVILARLIGVLGVAAAASLLASTVRAWFGGLERAHVAAVWLVVGRAGAVAGLVGAIAVDAGLVMLTVAVAVPQVVVYTGLLVWARRPPSPWARPDRATFARLIKSTSPLALWTVAGVFIAGIDIFTVRALDPSEVGRYAIALPLLTALTGVVTAAMSAWIPWVSRAEPGGAGGGRDLTLVGTGVMATVLSIGAVLYVGYGDEVVRLWAGTAETGRAAAYLRILYVASALRFVFLPWSVLVVVRGEQGLISFAPVTEAVVNVVASVVLGLWLGAIGVALGTLVGAVVAAGLYLGLAIPRTAGSGLTAGGLVGAALSAWPPLAAASGVALIAIVGAPAGLRAVAAVAAVGTGAEWLRRRRSALGIAVVAP
jgi:O-antigen/teichoic acid export membrane protein